jgi:hypothetical protein
LLGHPFVRCAERLPRKETLAALLKPPEPKPAQTPTKRVLSAFIGTFEDMATFLMGSTKDADGGMAILRAGRGVRTFQAAAGGDAEASTAIGDGGTFQLIGGVGTSPAPAPQACEKPPSSTLSDEQFMQVARAVSAKIPFVPLKLSGPSGADPLRLYKPYNEPPVVVEEEVVPTQRVLLAKRSPPSSPHSCSRCSDPMDSGRSWQSCSS